MKSQVANQYYEAEVLSEYIIKGNAAIIKCNIPSFVTDFAKVEAWLGSDGQEYNYDGSESNYGTNETIIAILNPFKLSLTVH
jgi:hypothetical protein